MRSATPSPFAALRDTLSVCLSVCLAFYWWNGWVFCSNCMVTAKSSVPPQAWSQEWLGSHYQQTLPQQVMARRWVLLAEFQGLPVAGQPSSSSSPGWRR
jgi:hypothetical protein